MSLAAIIARHSSLPPNEVREWASGSMEDIESAILFVLATWSGQSIAAFKKLTERLASTPASPVLLVCDIDNLSVETRRIFGSLRGAGETFWIRDGHVVASLQDYTLDDWVNAVDRNREMLRAPAR
ncbi:MAG: hypothetical protein Q8Q09_18630 [Deltaproteobacteria bacterium]|nr:hypothetical protein [Deltaproteobacteria bacterium]